MTNYENRTNNTAPEATWTQWCNPEDPPCPRSMGCDYCSG